jgi:hypothetical protein
MKEDFLAAVLDTLLPGGALANGVTVPAASAIGLKREMDRRKHGPLLAAIAEAAGGEEIFGAGTEEFRSNVLRRIEKQHAQDFASLVMAALVLYYEHPGVLQAFGWPSRPPQPQGHRMEPFDESLLAPVRARGKARP